MLLSLMLQVTYQWTKTIGGTNIRVSHILLFSAFMTRAMLLVVVLFLRSGVVDIYTLLEIRFIREFEM